MGTFRGPWLGRESKGHRWKHISMSHDQAVNLLTLRWQCCTTAPAATATSPSRTLLMTLASWWTPPSFYGDVKAVVEPWWTRADRRDQQGQEVSHLDVGQNVSARPVPAQALHVLLSRESEVVVATTRDVGCGGDRGTESADLPAPTDDIIAPAEPIRVTQR